MIGTGITGLYGEYMFLRKIIYIGESENGAVYFDTERQLALSAPKSQLLNTEGAGKVNRFIPLLVGFLIVGGGTSFFTVANPFGGRYSYGTLIFLGVTWLFEFIGMVWLLERALYKNVQQAQPTNRQNFRVAVYNNLIWRNFSDKKVTTGKIVVCWLFVSMIFLVNIACFPIFQNTILPLILNSSSIGSEIIMLSLLGIMPFSLVLLIWQNNPIRFMNLVGKYQKREIKWGKESKAKD